MANLNTRHRDFITKLKDFAETLQNMYGEAYALKESYAEEFATSQDHDLADVDNLEATYAFDETDVQSAVNQACVNYCNFWVGDAVGTRDYGKDLRRIK